MSDQQIQCSDCGNAFVFTDAERTFYDSKGLASPPKRCAPCRKARKLASPDRSAGGGGGSPRGRNGGSGGERRGGSSMGGSRGGGPRAPSEGRGWGKPSFTRSSSDRAPTRQVPATARGRGAPFGGSRAEEPRARPTPPATVKAPATPRPTRPKFDITCGACGTTAQVPFRPLEGRDVFCQPCYRARRGLPAVEATGLAVDVLVPDAVEGSLVTEKGESTG